MENRYWIDRGRSATGMAREAATAEARLIHYELAGRYSIMAAQSLSPSGRDRPVLHLAQPPSRPPAPAARRPEDERS